MSLRKTGFQKLGLSSNFIHTGVYCLRILFVTRQLPKRSYDLQELRSMGTVGSRPGHKGRKTTYYSPVSIEQFDPTKLDLK